MNSDSGETSAASALLEALVKYVGPARNESEVRRAINLWRNDVLNAGLQPEKLLIQFKDILNGARPARGSLALEHWEKDRREMIVMCIETFYTGNRDKSGDDI